jgi:alkaline phosphatase
MKKPFAAAILLILFVFCLAPSTADLPQNIILMIGDGMGVAHVTAGRTAKGSLALDAFKTVGLVLTHAHGDDYITDSAASATAMATGATTYNGAIGVGPDSVARKTALERARETGRRTGVVVSCSITHATPAAFVAHVPFRAMELEIAEQIARSETDLYLGGGWGWFLPEKKHGRRRDGRDLVLEMMGRGYAYVSSDEEFGKVDWGRTEKVLGLFAENHVGWAAERKPSLARMTARALEFLSKSSRGFFLVVEGSQIDWAGHNNDSRRIVEEMVDFDDAIAEALRFAGGHPNTLIIVTADHETGGYAIVGGSLRERRVEGKFSTDEHTGTMVPLFAIGPGAERFGGIRSHSDIGEALLEMLQ